MIVVEQRRGSYGLGNIPDRSRTMGCPGARTIVLNRTAEAVGARLSVSPAGTGELSFSTVPTWAWAAGGALVVGLVVGAIYFKKRKG